MKRGTIDFYSCNTESDIAAYADDIVKAGGSVLSMNINAAVGMGSIYMQCRDFWKFYHAFEKTSSFPYSSLK